MKRTLLLLDLAAVVLFAALGRDTHDEAASVAGALGTAAPFLAATAGGWLVTRAWRNPLAMRTGLGVAATTVAGGMVLRRLAGDGTAPAFVIVATVFLTGALLGWRAAAGRLRPAVS